MGKKLRASLLLLCAVLTCMGLQLRGIAAAAGENIAPNASLETVATGGTTPQSWSTDKWGTNTTSFSYASTGHTGSRSVKTTVTAYTNGDAKWAFSPVTVNPGRTYTYSDYYQASAATQVFVQYTSASGAKSYEWLGSSPASNAWAQATFTFSLPADVAKVSVYHLINSVGWLVIDDISLTEIANPAPAPSTSLVPNDSVEQAAAGNAAKPANWTSEAWGANTTNFEYLVGGHAGNRSVKATVSGYTKGDAKWYFDPIIVSPNKDYTLKDFYKSSVATTVVLVTYDAANKPTYTELGKNVPASPAAWQTFSATFKTSATAKKLTVFHMIKANGWLQLDDLTIVDPTTPLPPVTNLVTNPSVELSATGTSPDDWSSSKWGANTTSFDYLTSGRSGGRSVRTTVTAFTDGDAKWFFRPVTVVPGATYRYTEYYQSTINTELVLQYTNSDNTTSYAWLGTIPASAAWSQLDYSFLIPSSARSVTVFHLVAGVGTLVVDDVALSRVVISSSENPIANPSVEQPSLADATRPNSWSPNSWGDQTANFEYMSEGHTGSRSIKLTVSNYTTGDAKWLFSPIVLERGKSYRFTAWYKTNTTPHPEIMFTQDDNTVRYSSLPITQPNGTADWQKYTDTFTVPQNVKSATVFMLLSSNGWLQTDDYSIEPYEPVGFARPLVSLTFDDGFEDNVTNVLPVLGAHSLLSTQCFMTQFAEASPAAIDAFKNAGHEICSHTVTHPFLSQLSAADVEYELAHSQSVLRTMTGQPVSNFASPYGDYNAAVSDAIKRYYRSHRTVDEGYNSKDTFDIYRTRVQNMTPTTSLAEFQGWVDHAKATKTWLVLVYHRVSDTDVGPFDTYTADFAKQMDALTASNVVVKTYNDALDELVPQLP